MCGISGIVTTSKTSKDRLVLADGGFTSAKDVLSRMQKAIEHRGPDDQGTVLVDEVGLGHTRLAIIDLSASGHQPMCQDSTKNWITFNGEIYNYKNVRLLLEDQSWKSNSDTEVILAAYKKGGKDCLIHLRGRFALAIWDASSQELFLTRDRLGIKPVYWYAGDGFFLFASEIRALLASGLVPRRLDPVALCQYLTYQSVPAPRTLIKGIHALPPGSWLTFDRNGRINAQRYWDMLANASMDARQDSLSDARKKIGNLLRESIALHMVSDVPVGAFLSGGIDSSVVVA